MSNSDNQRSQEAIERRKFGRRQSLDDARAICIRISRSDLSEIDTFAKLANTYRTTILSLFIKKGIRSLQDAITNQDLKEKISYLKMLDKQ